MAAVEATLTVLWTFAAIPALAAVELVAAADEPSLLSSQAVVQTTTLGGALVELSPDITAIGAALCRARHVRDDPPPPILDDFLAAKLCADEADAFIDAMPPILSTNLTFVLRARFAEDRVQAARARGVAQYVILGAGLDTFAYRWTGQLDGLAIFEVDHPGMQAWKRRRAEELGLVDPPEFVYVPVDFETMSLAGALTDAGVRTHKPTVFSWLGVTQYLTSEAIESTLHVLASWPESSEAVITYLLPREQWGQDAEFGQAAELVAERRGNNWLSFFTPEQVEELGRRCGFSRVEHFGPEEAKDAYFTDHGDNLQPCVLERSIVAIV